MRPRFWILILLVLFSTAAWLFRSSVARQQESPPKQTPSSETKQLVPFDQTTGENGSPLAPIVRIPKAIKRSEQLRESIDSKNVPIAFWGKVVDQDGNALEGARVKIGIRQWLFAVSAGPAIRDNKSEVQTFGDGIFSISNVNGDVLSIDEISKAGYELSPRSIRAFNYTRGSVANQANPAVYRMWKKGNPQQLAKFDKNMRIPYDGTVVTFDLIKGTKASGAEISGDLRITLVRTPLKIELGRREKYDWAATIEAVDGGVTESADEFMYRAPETGYSPKIEIKMPASDPNWSRDKRTTLYFKSRGGECYGRAMVEFRSGSDQPTTGFTITSAMNCSGSRSLE